MELIPIVCPKCNKGHCVPYALERLLVVRANVLCRRHRLPVDHNCASLEAKPAAKPPRTILAVLARVYATDAALLTAPRAARPQFIQQKVTDFQSARSKKAAAQVRRGHAGTRVVASDALTQVALRQTLADYSCV